MARPKLSSQTRACQRAKQVVGACLVRGAWALLALLQGNGHPRAVILLLLLGSKLAVPPSVPGHALRSPGEWNVFWGDGDVWEERQGISRRIRGNDERGVMSKG